MLYDFVSGRGIDGMALDARGRVWATAGTKEKAGIYVFAPDARRGTAKIVAFIPTPEDPTNCTFGGQKRDILLHHDHEIALHAPDRRPRPAEPSGEVVERSSAGTSRSSSPD